MNGLRWMSFPLAAAAALSGCGKPATASGGTGPATSTKLPPGYINLPGLPTAAQSKLPTIKVWVGAEELITEMAVSPIQVETGMMFRTNMAENEAMVFVLPYVQQAGFWMANCPHSLSVAYINTDGVIEEIHPLEPFNTNTVFAAVTNIRFALETPQGWFDRHHISTGAVVRTERGSLKQTFLEKQ
jgi:uncharacterized protein